MAGPSRGRARSRLLLLVLSAVTLLTLDFRGFGPLESVQRTMRSALAPVRSGVSWATRPITDGLRGVVDYGSLKDENRRLREQLAELEGREIQSDVDADTLRRLLAEAEITYVGDHPRVVTRVVAGSIGNFDGYRVEIDKGTNHGLAPDMPVVSAAGLVGRIVEADRNRSQVQLITSPQFAVGVRVEHEVALAKGRGAGNALLAEGIAIEAPIEVGDIVLTNGQDRSRFPPDIPVGRVRSVDRSSGALSVEIAPVADVANADFLTVVRYVAPS